MSVSTESVGKWKVFGGGGSSQRPTKRSICHPSWILTSRQSTKIQWIGIFQDVLCKGSEKHRVCLYSQIMAARSCEISVPVPPWVFGANEWKSGLYSYQITVLLKKWKEWLQSNTVKMNPFPSKWSGHPAIWERKWHYLFIYFHWKDRPRAG